MAMVIDEEEKLQTREPDEPVSLSPLFRNSGCVAVECLTHVSFQNWRIG